MRYDEFVKHVQAHVDTASKDEALRAIHATLETLGERLSKKEREDLAAQLPKELRPDLLKREHEPFDLEEFYNRISARAGVRRPHAIDYARAVIKTLNEAVSPGEIDDIRIELAPAFDPLFEDAR